MFPTRFFHSNHKTLTASWRSLVAADMLYKLLAFAVLIPLFVVMFQCVLALGGKSFLSDVDIAVFFAGPVGWLCAIVLGAGWLTILALEQATLLCMMATHSSGRPVSVIAALRFTAEHVFTLLVVAARVIGWSLLILAPFVLIAGGVYFWLLGNYDINYYLNQRPSEFRVAVGIGVVLAFVLVGLLLRIYSGWFLALPLVLFDQVPASEALAVSRSLVVGHRRRVLLWLMTWGCAVFVLNVLLTAAVGGAGRLLIPSSVGSLTLLATRIGLLIMVLAVAGLVLNLFAAISVAGLLFCGYQEIKPKSAEAMSVVPGTNLTNPPSDRLFTRTRLLIAGVCGTIAAATIGYWSLESVHFVDEVQVMAHRGASKKAPENTLAAFRQAIADGADWIELDVQETADGEVVVMHDSDFMKLSKNPLKIRDAQFRDLSGIDIGSWFDGRFSSERVPTLARVLRLCKDKIGVNIELKYYGHEQQLEQRVVDIVEGEGMAEQIMVMSLKPDGVAKIKALRPAWKCGLLLSVYVGDLQHITADFLAVNAQFATRNFVKRAHNIDKQVFAWTVNDVVIMSQLLNRNVDGILTDRPELARQVLKQRSEMNTSQRLLAEISVFFNQPVFPTEP